MKRETWNVVEHKDLTYAEARKEVDIAFNSMPAEQRAGLKITVFTTVYTADEQYYTVVVEKNMTEAK